MQNPPDGMIADDIRRMSEDDLLDMDYFLHEDDEFGEDLPGVEASGVSNKLCITCRLFDTPYSFVLSVPPNLAEIFFL